MAQELRRISLKETRTY